jgi:hypothetical protein
MIIFSAKATPPFPRIAVTITILIIAKVSAGFAITPSVGGPFRQKRWFGTRWRRHFCLIIGYQLCCDISVSF